MMRNNLLTLLRLSSQSLPIGAFSYSQGLEWAIDSGRVIDERTTQHWIESMLHGPYENFELPFLRELFEAWKIDGYDRVKILDDDYFASRETREIQEETRQMGYAFKAVVKDMGIGSDVACDYLTSCKRVTFPTVLAFCGAHYSLTASELLSSATWCFIENQVLVAIKAIPLGQSAGQKLLTKLIPKCEAIVENALQLDEENWSNFSPMQAIASSKHETQYSRLFRS